MNNIDHAIKEIKYAKKWILGHSMEHLDEPIDDDVIRLIHIVTALEAYKVIDRVDISGYDEAYVLRLMNDLYNGFPLSPIEDIPEIWHETPIDKGECNTVYQCSRYSPLFKTVHNDGRIEFDDVSRCEGHDIEAPEGYTFSSRRIRKIVNQYYPITMPYTPPRKPYIVECYQFKYDENDDKNDWDTQAFFYIKFPYSQEKISLDIYERLNTVTDDWEPISKEEYVKRARAYSDRMRNRKEAL